mmetsp:Transcript_18214/g.43563  ORF Transcript_18214/g.43563 Transcript_18214/m.43563 type:complete len:86 (-) Transcript_18214:1196-1453(-)
MLRSEQQAWMPVFPVPLMCDAERTGFHLRIVFKAIEQICEPVVGDWQSQQLMHRASEHQQQGEGLQQIPQAQGGAAQRTRTWLWL